MVNSFFLAEMDSKSRDKAWVSPYLKRPLRRMEEALAEREATAEAIGKRGALIKEPANDQTRGKAGGKDGA